VFYGWRIVAAAFAVIAFAWSTRASFAVIYAAMLADLGWSRSEGVFGYSLSWLLLVVFSPLTGWLYDRVGPRTVVPLGGIALALGLALTGLAAEPWHYYLAFGPLVAFGISATLNPSNALMSRWFVRRRGATLGILAAGSSAGTILSLPVIAAATAAFGWRATLFWYALILLLVLVPVPALVYRRDPAAMGLFPDGDKTAPRARHASHPMTQSGLGAAMRSVQFWAVFVMTMLGVVTFQIVTTHQIAFAADKEIAPATAAVIFGLAGAYQLAGNVLSGMLSDRWGRQGLFLFGTVLGVLAIAILLAVAGPGDVWKLHVFAVAMGIGAGARIAMSQAIPADVFGGPRFGLILGALQAGGGIGGFVGPMLGGVIFDLSGSYEVAFAVAGMTVVLSAVAAWLARTPTRSSLHVPEVMART
jgi:MFS family permease